MKKILVLSLALLAVAGMQATADKNIKKQLDKVASLNKNLNKARKEVLESIKATGNKKAANYIKKSIDHNKTAGKHTSKAIDLIQKQQEELTP